MLLILKTEYKQETGSLCAISLLTFTPYELCLVCQTLNWQQNIVSQNSCTRKFHLLRFFEVPVLPVLLWLPLVLLAFQWCLGLGLNSPAAQVRYPAWVPCLLCSARVTVSQWGWMFHSFSLWFCWSITGWFIHING